MLKCDFSKVKSGDVIFTLLDGEVLVGGVKDNSFQAGHWWFKKDGSLYGSNASLPVAFWSQPEITIPPPLKRKVKKDVEFWVDFDSKGKVRRFTDNHAYAAALGGFRHYTDTIEVEE